MKILFTVSMFLILLFSCSQSEKKTEKKDHKIKIDELKSNLTRTYNINYCLDTVGFENYKYTIDYNDIIKSGNVLVTDYKINDIYKADTSYYINISCGELGNIFLKLLIVNHSDIDLLKKLDEVEGAFVFSLDKIKKVDFTYKNDTWTEDSGDEENQYSIEHTDIAFSQPEAFYGLGSLIFIKK